MDQGGPSLAYGSKTEWLRGGGESGDVVMSSRVRVARNLVGFPFVSRCKRTDKQQVLDVCRSRVLEAGLAPSVLFFELQGTGTFERSLLAERQLISRQHAKGKAGCVSGGGTDEPRGVAVGVPAERLSVMVNEEDHLRIQVMCAGLALREAWEQLDEADDRIEAGLSYAFSPRFGYLTACPTNVGTGVRFSVMLHLPALRMRGQIDKVRRAAGDLSLAVRGFFGEGSEALGDFYQISNQTTLGKSESVIMHELEQEILPGVIEYERAERATLVSKRRGSLTDTVGRAIGVLRHAKLMAVDESMQLLSMLRLGIVTDLVRGVSESDVNHLMLLTQPAHLQHHVGRELTQEQRRVERAALMCRALAAAECSS